MRTQTWTRQLIAFVAAGVIVFTAVDVWIVWRNQSADRVMKTQNGQVLYQSNDYAIGTLHKNQTDVATVLHLSPDGGWALEGSAAWLSPTVTATYGQFAIIPSLSSDSSAGSYWLCAVSHNPTLTTIQLYNNRTHKMEEQYDLHHGGLIEPVMIHAGTELRLVSGQQIVLTVPIPAAPSP